MHDLRGRVTINSPQATPKSDILPGDRIVTGSDGHFVFVMGQDAFMVRSRSEIVIERYEAQGLLRLITGVYLETRGDGTYFCTCWGAVDLASIDDERDRELIESRGHVPRLIVAQPRDGTRFRPAPFETHTDAEMDILEKCVGRRSPLVVPPAAQRK